MKSIIEKFRQLKNSNIGRAIQDASDLEQIKALENARYTGTAMEWGAKAEQVLRDAAKQRREKRKRK